MSEDSHDRKEAAEAAELLRDARMPDPPSLVKERIRRALAERPARRAGLVAWRPLFVALGLLLAGAAAASTWILLRQLRKSAASERARVAPAVESAPANATPTAPAIKAPAAPSTRLREQPPISPSGAAEGAARSRKNLESAPPAALRPRPAAKRNVVRAEPAPAPAQLALAAAPIARAEPAPPRAQSALAEPVASSEEIIRLLQSSSRTPSPPAKASSPEAELVLDATLALRRAHEPRRSLNLLKQYLTRYPHGALIEESMALAMEAMAALNDASASRVAADYLQRYPAGRFCGLARTAIQRFAR